MTEEGADPPWQTVINLYNSGIPTEIIALQLDISQEEVNRMIESIIAQEAKNMSLNYHLHRSILML
jgi:DNA-binding transcriptional regulator LsrR (DeoR family)